MNFVKKKETCYDRKLSKDFFGINLTLTVMIAVIRVVQTKT